MYSSSVIIRNTVSIPTGLLIGSEAVVLHQEQGSRDDPRVIKLLTKSLSKDVNKQKLAHFSSTIKEMLAVSAGVIVSIVGPCDNTQKAYSSHL